MNSGGETESKEEQGAGQSESTDQKEAGLGESYQTGSAQDSQQNQQKVRYCEGKKTLPLKQTLALNISTGILIRHSTSAKCTLNIIKYIKRNRNSDPFSGPAVHFPPS